MISTNKLKKHYKSREKLQKKGKGLSFNTFNGTFPFCFLNEDLCLFILHWTPHIL